MNALTRLLRPIRVTLSIVSCAALLLGAAQTTAEAQVSRERYYLDIPSQDLHAALQQLALASRCKLLYRSEIATGKTSHGLRGVFTAEQAFETILAGTDLTYEMTPSSVVLVREKGDAAQPDSASGTSSVLRDDMGTAEARYHSAVFNDMRVGTAPEAPMAQVAPTASSEGPPELKQFAIRDIVVTARRREERLQDVPVSVSVYSGADIEAKSLGSLKELAQFTPNFTFSNSGARGRGGGALFIRGVGQQEADIMWEPGVGVYVDGVYIARMQGLDLDLMDLERVEVLRGPQGTLFGKNTIGGVINMVTARPTGEFGGRAEIVGGSFDRFDGKLSLDVPIVPGTLAAKFAAATYNKGGYGKRIDYFTGQKRDEASDVDSLSGRAIFHWTPTDAADVLLSIDGRRTRETGPVMKLAATGSPGLVTLLNRFVDPDFGSSFLTSDEFTTFGAGPNSFNLNNWGVGLNAVRKGDGWQFKSITAYRNLEVRSGLDVDGSPFQLLEQVSTWNQHQFSQEFQLSGLAADDRLDWLFGAYYFNESADEGLATVVMGPLYESIGLDLSATPSAWSEVRSYALFGHANYAFDNRLSVTAGLRYSEDRKELARTRFSQVTGVVIAPLDSRHGNWGALSGQAGLEYRWNEEVMTYLSVSRGFKSGGYNTSSQNSLNFRPFEPEYILTYELGLKSDLFDRRVRFNTAAFFSDYSDMQFIVRGIDPVTGVSTNFVANAAKSEVKGFEMQFDASPGAGLLLGAGVGYLDAAYTKVEPGSAVTTSNEFVETPQWTLNLSGQYSHSFVDGGSLVARVDYSHKAKIQHDLANSPIAQQSGFGLLNARLTFENAKGDWSVAVFGTNLTDERYLLGGVDVRASLGFAATQYAPPREWGLSVRYSF